MTFNEFDELRTTLLMVALSWFVGIAGYLIHPVSSRCPAGWHNDGVRPSGRFSCVRDPGGDPAMDGTFGTPDGTIDLPGEIRSRIYCTGGAVPIVIDQRTVGCQHR